MKTVAEIKYSLHLIRLGFADSPSPQGEGFRAAVLSAFIESFCRLVCSGGRLSGAILHPTGYHRYIYAQKTGLLQNAASP
ncbi:MAG: hypothetical protein IJB25_02555 [Clostridia bacterium]|nr:hypothetical protein [Clostridia bacterium]